LIVVPQASAVSRSDAYVGRVTSENDESLAEFFRTVWGGNATGPVVAAARAANAASNPAFPGADVPEFVFVLNGQVIGYLGCVPVSFWNGTGETPTYWLKGFMVHPDHRNGPVGFNLLKEAVKVIGPSGTVAAAPAARRLLTALGFVECGAIPNFVCVLRAGRFMSIVDVDALGSRLPRAVVRTLAIAQRAGVMHAAGALVSLGLAGWKQIRGVNHTGYRLHLDGALPGSDDLNALWASARLSLKAAAVRDGVFLPWRYHCAPGSTYEAVSVRDGVGRLVAVAVVRKPSDAGDVRLRGVKLAVLSDILFAPDDPTAGVMALDGAEQVAVRMGADAMLCSATAAATQEVLRRRAYLRIPANVFLLVRDPHASLGLPTSIGDWWLTRGDDKADDAF
jgi:GNAT superfamily N-acetyltransferase